MKRILTLFTVVLSSVLGTAQVFNTNYVFPSSSIPEYDDRSTLKATELVNQDEIITVGFALEPLSNSKHDLILTNTKSSNGAVIWAKRYGLQDLDEKGFGLTLSYDGKHVIVAGTAEDKENPGDWKALAMKVEISTGNVIWSTFHGKKGSYQEFRMVEQAYPGPLLPADPTYFFVGRTSIENEVKAVIYAAGIFDSDGSDQFAHIYVDADLFPKVNDLAFQMTRDNDNKNYIIAGTRYEDNIPSDLFTFGISPFDGSITDKYIWYDVDEKNQYEGAVCNVVVDNFNGYGLAGTTRNPTAGLDEAITVLWLDNNRSVINTHYYAEDGHPSNKGLSIYQSTEKLKTFDVYTSTTRNITSPGFLNVDLDGPFNYYLKYNDDIEFNDLEPTAMVRTKTGYTAKALHNAGSLDNGYKLAGLDPSGKTECAKEEKMDLKEREAKFETREYKDDKFGEDDKRDMDVKEVNGKWVLCDGSDGDSFKYGEGNDNEVDASSNFSAYPNPLNDDQGEFTISYNLEQSSEATLEVYNALGQQVYTNVEMLNAGGDQITIDTDFFSSGVNFVVLRSGSNVVYQQKVIKK